MNKIVTKTQKAFDKLIKNIRHFIDAESGQGILEYAMILAFVAVMAAFVLTGSATSLKTTINAAFSNVASTLNTI